MAPTIQSDNELSSEFHVVAIIVFVAFAIVCGLSIVVVLIMCCDDEKKKKKEATPRSVKSKSTRFEAERKFVAIAEKPKEDIEQRNVKLKKDVSFRAKDSSQISRMGSFQMQSNQLQEKKGGRSQSFAKGPAGAYDGSKTEPQSLHLMTTRDADEKKPARSLTMKNVGEKKFAKQLTQKKGARNERKVNKSIKERKSVKSVKKTEVKSVKDPEVKTAKKDKRIPKHLRPESTHYNIPMNMDM